MFSTSSSASKAASAGILATLLCSASVQAFCGAHTHVHHSVMKRQEGGEALLPAFSYDATTGPLLWHTLQTEFAACAEGSRQSPINLDSILDRAISGEVQLNLPTQDVKFENLGTTVEVIATGSMTFQNSSFNLAQFHVHTPSEHHINGEHFDAEIHMVFNAADNPQQIGVVSFLLDGSVDRTIAPLETVFARLPDIQTPGSSVDIAQLNLAPLIAEANSRNFFRYSGSLTTPPCSEVVSWFVADRPLEMSASTLVAIKRTVGMNARFTQVAPDNQNILLAAGRSLNLGQAAVDGSAVTIGEGSASATTSEAAQSTQAGSAPATSSETVSSIGATATSTASGVSSAEAVAHSAAPRRAKRRLA